MPSVVVVGELEEDQSEDWNRILAWLEIGVRAQFVGCIPEILFELFKLLLSHSSPGGLNRNAKFEDFVTLLTT